MGGCKLLHLNNILLLINNIQAYETVIRAIEQFFHDSGICIVTLQPEFLMANGKIVGGERPAIGDTGNCLMNCNHAECQEKACCKLDSENNLCRDGVTGGPGSQTNNNQTSPLEIK